MRNYALVLSVLKLRCSQGVRIKNCVLNVTSPGGGGGTPLYKPYRYVPTHQVGFLRRFGLKACLIHFAHFGLESGMVFEGTTECMNQEP